MCSLIATAIFVGGASLLHLPPKFSVEGSSAKFPAMFVFNGERGVKKTRILSEIFCKIYYEQLDSYCDSFPIGVRLNDFARFCQGRVIHSMIP